MPITKSKGKKPNLLKVDADSSESDGNSSEHELFYYKKDKVKLMKEVLKLIKPKKIKQMAPDCIKVRDYYQSQKTIENRNHKIFQRLSRYSTILITGHICDTKFGIIRSTRKTYLHIFQNKTYFMYLGAFLKKFNATLSCYQL